MYDPEKALAYAAQIQREGDGFVVNFRDLENVFTEGDTYETALLNAQTVLGILLEDMFQDKLAVPEPTPCRKGEVLIPLPENFAKSHGQKAI